MTAKLTIVFSDDVLEALKSSKTLTISMTSASGRGGGEEPRAGSLPARLIEWSQDRKGTFGTKDVVKRFRLSRAHASMLLSRLANGPYPIERLRRGIYKFRG